RCSTRPIRALHSLARRRSSASQHRVARSDIRTGVVIMLSTPIQMDTTAMPVKPVDANYRFMGAYQEVNARISQRQHALALYLTLVVSLLAALVALKPSEGGGTVPVEWLLLGFPVASICLAFLNY